MANSNFIYPQIFKSPTKAFFTTRKGGVSHGVYASLNLGDHVGDNLNDVIKNRNLVLAHSSFKKLVWMKQTHSAHVEEVTLNNADNIIEADAIVTKEQGLGLAVMTADCLPVLLSATNLPIYAAVHCGWRGLYNQILRNTIELMHSMGANGFKAVLGPAIGFDSFEIGSDLKNKFLERNAPLSAFKETSPAQTNKVLCSLYTIAQDQLLNLGLNTCDIETLAFDTFKLTDTFFSYRKENVTGRMAGIIGGIS